MLGQRALIMDDSHWRMTVTDSGDPESGLLGINTPGDKNLVIQWAEYAQTGPYAVANFAALNAQVFYLPEGAVLDEEEILRNLVLQTGATGILNNNVADLRYGHSRYSNASNQSYGQSNRRGATLDGGYTGYRIPMASQLGAGVQSISDTSSLLTMGGVFDKARLVNTRDYTEPGNTGEMFVRQRNWDDYTWDVTIATSSGFDPGTAAFVVQEALKFPQDFAAGRKPIIERLDARINSANAVIELVSFDQTVPLFAVQADGGVAGAPIRSDFGDASLWLGNTMDANQVALAILATVGVPPPFANSAYIRMKGRMTASPRIYTIFTGP